MQRTTALIALIFFLLIKLSAQNIPLNYYLPETTYDPAIPAPEQFFGCSPGEWHLSHDQLVAYYKVLDAASDRITMKEYGRSHENRPMLLLTITSRRNQDNISAIRDAHVALCDPARSAALDVTKMPVVIWQGFSIHGNEPSGANATPMVAYRLAAAQDAETLQLLDEAVILLDPCFNPDGFSRFASWANQNKNRNLTAESADREYNEPWPQGRTNHYWFDLNRDWLPGQQPESAGRIRMFHYWKPNVLTDHHEMGSNSTFFFMPGVQSRVNPLTPKRNQELTAKIGTFHAKALDAIGSLYYSEEGFDDFYYGKGSTFPDANGCIGILFEQASSRGHLQNTENGQLSFPFTIRNQARTALSTQTAAIALRTELLDFQREFFKTAIEEAKRDERRAFIVGEEFDHTRLMRFVEMLRRQQIQVYELNRPVSPQHSSLKTHNFSPGSAYVIPLEQPQYKLILGIFQRETTFSDSIFYDISAWTMPLAFNLAYDVLGKNYSKDLLGKEVGEVKMPEGKVNGAATDYAYAFDWDEYLSPAALHILLKSKLLVKVASRPFSAKTKDGVRRFNYGAIVVSTQNQPMSGEAFFKKIEEAAKAGGVTVYGIETGLTPEGVDLGSSSNEPLRLPVIALLTGEGIGTNDAGEIWHLLDTRYGIPVTKIDGAAVGQGTLSKFNTVIMAGGSYDRLNVDFLRSWVNNGGTLIAYKGALKFLQEKSIANIEIRKPKEDPLVPPRRSYTGALEDADAQTQPGAIFETELDPTHPLSYGYHSATLPLFRTSNDVLEPAQSAYASPLVFTQNPLMAGYLHPKYKDAANGTPAVLVSAGGSGRVICFLENTNFRAFWYGTNKLLANAIFFGNTIAGSTMEKARRKATE